MQRQREIDAKVEALINEALRPKLPEILPGVEIERVLVRCCCGGAWWFEFIHHAELCPSCGRKMYRP